MPPWPPAKSYHNLADKRILSESEIMELNNWVNNGAPIGALDEVPTPPVIESEAFMTNPDLVIEGPAYTSMAIDGDDYRCFVIDPQLGEDVFINGYEVLPGNRNIVHHVLIFADQSGTSTLLDQQDGDEGYVCFGGIGTNSAELIGGWVPGSRPYLLPEGFGIRLSKNAKIVVQIHYPQGSEGKIDQTTINFKFTKDHNVRTVRVNPFLNHVLSMVDGPLHVPANTVKSFKQRFEVLFDFTFFGAAPHMHLIGRSIKTYAVLPGGDTLKLMDIPHWDFEWQGFYSFKNPVKIPKGSVLYADAVYDNTPGNIHNPNSPPRDVFVGEATTDEMMLVYFPWTIYREGDELIEIKDQPLIELPECGALATHTEETIASSVSFDAFPNPAHDQFQIRATGGAIHFSATIYNKTGQALKYYPNAVQQLTVPTRNWASGLYIVEVTTKEGRREQLKVFLK